MPFSNPSARRAFFAGKKAAEKELKGEGFTSNPKLDVPDPTKELSKLIPKAPKAPKFPKISSMMKIPRK